MLVLCRVGMQLGCRFCTTKGIDPLGQRRRRRPICYLVVLYFVPSGPHAMQHARTRGCLLQSMLHASYLMGSCTHTLPGIIGGGLLWHRRHTLWGWYELHNNVVKSTESLLQMGFIVSEFLLCNFRVAMSEGACKTFVHHCCLRIVT